MSNNEDDLLKQVTQKWIGGFTPSPFFNYNPSPEEQQANANLINQRAETERENRVRTVRWRRAEGGIIGFILGMIVMVIIFAITKWSF